MLTKLTGPIVHGQGKGRLAGFPTANLQCENAAVLPPDGVYAMRVYIDDAVYAGVTNIGTRPTADDRSTTTVETWILDYEGDLYDQTITIQPYAFLRDTRKFSSMEDLKSQIDCDAERAKSYLNDAPALTAAITFSASETQRLAARIGNMLQKGDILVLRGNLGAGKSEFARGLARGLGIEGAVPSPSFTILNVHENGKLPMYHFDWYRISDPEELYEIGIEEYLPGDGVTLIEWAERAEELLPERRLEVHIETLNAETRLLRICPLGGFPEIRLQEDME